VMFENYWFWMCFATVQSVFLAIALVKIFLDETRVQGRRKK
jgi:hypothetical protein